MAGGGEGRGRGRQGLWAGMALARDEDGQRGWACAGTAQSGGEMRIGRPWCKHCPLARTSVAVRGWVGRGRKTGWVWLLVGDGGMDKPKR